ncbi:MAG: ABC transporter permease [Syntrophales bacterium]|nr:ABC transporter permease [Syntrophales bacterium]
MILRELSGLTGVWWREFKVFWRERSRIVASIISPLMWLFIFGSGVGAHYSVAGVSYRDFIYPGILAMTVIFGSVFFGLYIVWDRKIDVFKAVLVAPLSRTSIFLGKVLGGCTDVLLQVMVLFLFSFLFSAIDPRGLPQAFLFLFLSSVAFVSLGLAIGSLLKSLEGFQLISAFVIFPLYFSSGALFPVDRQLPSWLDVLVMLNPLSYTVDGVRGSLMGIHHHPLMIDFIVVSTFAFFMVMTGSFLFSRMKI